MSTRGEAQATTGRKGLNITLWVVQILLALAYISAGVQKTFMPLQEVAKTIFWVSYVPSPLVRFIGVSELLGAIGLILPAALKIKPGLTALAAAGLSVIMLSASVMHAVRGEYFALPTTLILLALASFIAYGRWRLTPIRPASTLHQEPELRK